MTTPPPDCGCRVADTRPWALELCARHSDAYRRLVGRVVDLAVDEHPTNTAEGGH